MQTQTRNPLHWLMLLVTLLACLGAQTLGLKTASGQIYGPQSASWDAAPWEAAPRLGLRGLVEKIVSAPPVGANGGVGTAASGTANTVSGARLNMQLSAEQAAGTRAPTTITSYSDHAIKQLNNRDGGIGVSQAAVNDAFANPVSIQYVPNQYGPTFKYIGKDATVVVNSQGNAVTTWGTNSAGTGK